jgi:hypothetical protein
MAHLKKVAIEEKTWIPASAGMTKKGTNPIRLTAQG